MKNYKTFKDLKFKPHGLAKDAYILPAFSRDRYGNAKQAVMEFENDYGVSVLMGECFYSNGVDTYELGVLYEGGLTYNTDITDDVIGYITEEEVTEIMKRVQDIQTIVPDDDNPKNHGYER